MKDGEKTYSTSQIAGIVGLHPNTVRKYEEWGLLQTPERKPNGYWVYTDVHIKQFELAKKALQSVIVQAGEEIKNAKEAAEICEVLCEASESEDSIVSACDKLVLSLEEATQNAYEVKQLLLEIKEM